MAERAHRLRLSPSPGSVAEGRRWAVRQARAAGADLSVQRTLELLSSELVTNAIVHTHTRRPITVDTTVYGGRLRMSVTDPDTTLPVVRPSSVSRPGGDGLRIIDVLADRWGIDLHPGVGKTVWVETNLRAHSRLALAASA